MIDLDAILSFGEILALGIDAVMQESAGMVEE